MAGGIGVITKSLLLIGCAIASASRRLPMWRRSRASSKARSRRSSASRDLSALTQTDAASPSSAAAEGYGHALLMRRHLAPAAWMYAAAVEREPARASAITALGVTLVEGATTGGKSRASEADLAAAVELQREAVRLMPKEGVAHHNLGTALLRLAQARGNDRALLEEAAKSLREAAALGGRRAPHFNVRLAEALNALGDRAGAEAALREAFAVNPTDPVLMMARVSSLADVPVQGEPARLQGRRLRLQEELPAGAHRADDDGRLRDRQFQCRRAPAATASPIPRATIARASCRASGFRYPASIQDFRSRRLGVRSTSPCRATAASTGRRSFNTPADRRDSRGSWVPRGATSRRPARPISASTGVDVQYSLDEQQLRD